MRNMLIIRLGIILGLSIILISSFTTTCSGEENKTSVSVYETVFSYDIFLNSSGEWTDRGSPGETVTFSQTAEITNVTGMKLVDVEVCYFDNNPIHRLYSMAVKSSEITVTGFNSTSVSFNVNAILEANISPGEIKKVSAGVSLLGYRYYFPVVIKMYYEGYDEGSAESESAPTESRSDYLPKADICMPTSAYQNHPVLIQDMSIFSLGEDYYPAYQFYKKGYGSNSIRVLNPKAPVSISRINTAYAGYYSDREAIFSQPGTYYLSLAASVNGGQTSVDIGRINILPVPEISGQINGYRTALSKMTLVSDIILDPTERDYTVEIIIRESGGSEEARAKYSTDSGFSEPVNSERIKLNHPVFLSESSEEVTISLDFLTKNTQTKHYEYSLKVTDGGGKTDEYIQYFSVSGAVTPSVEIKGDSQYLRTPGTNTAEIRLSDASGLSSDYARTWYIWNGSEWTSDFEYTDYSFGSKKTIAYNKTGTGKVKFMLKLSRILEDGSFECKYLSPDEVGEGYAIFEAEVVNSAPVVSLSDIKIPESRLVVLYDDDHESEALAQKTAIEAALASGGMESEIIFQKVNGYSDDEAGPGPYHVLESPYSYNAESYSYNRSNYISDSKRMYKVGANFGKYGGGSFYSEKDPQPPYNVIACDIETGEVLWNISFSSSTFNLSNNFTVHQDDKEEYLYLSSRYSTLVIDKTNGQIVKTLSLVVGDCIYANKYIYSFTNKGITQITLSSGNSKQVYSGEVQENPTNIDGKIRFAVKTSSAMKIGKVVPETGAVTINSSFSSGGAKAEFCGFDSQGNMIVFDNTGTTQKTSTVYLYSSDLQLLKTIVTLKGVKYITPVKNNNGIFTHVVLQRFFIETGPPETHIVRYFAYDLSEDNPSPLTIRLETTNVGYLTSNSVLWARTTKNGVKLITSSLHDYKWSADENNSHLPLTVSCTIDFNMKSRTASFVTSVPDYTTSQGNQFDSSYVDDDSVCLQYTLGNPVNDGISGSSTVFFPLRKSISSSVEYCLNNYLTEKEDCYNGVFIISSSRGSQTSDDTTRIYWVDDVGGLNASVNDFISYVTTKGSGGDSPSLVYEKGEKINLKGIYKDYEEDPSKESCYVYYHYPYNDGPNPDVNYITDSDFNTLSVQTTEARSSPINQFWQDGMYKVEHWQYDSTGDPSYEKKSNVATMVFYVKSDGGSSYPSTGNISIIPSAPKEGEAIDVTATVNDPDGDSLNVTLSAYNGSELIKEERFTGLTPTYSPVTMHITDSAAPGKYTVICTVSDGKHQVSDSKVFVVTSSYTVSGGVNHTEQWDSNRKRYNQYLFGYEMNEEVDNRIYSLKSAPRQRGTNVFWSEEKLVLQVSVTGSPTSVCAELEGSGITGTLTKSGLDSSGASVYTGSLWSSSLKGKYGRNHPEEKAVIITANYSDGSSVKKGFTIIYDDSDDYWRVHRLY